MARVCVIGAGPAGSVFASRMAQLGHGVTLVERLAFPRTTLGESLSPGVLPLLEMIGAREEVEAAGFTRVRTVSTTWDGELRQRDDPAEGGRLVDRGRFDALLLDRARGLGVRVLQPATVRERRFAGGRWWLRADGNGGVEQIEADFLADASGRRGALPAHRARDPISTIALYAYWRGTALPAQPRIDAGADAWYWGVPLPDGRYNTLVFLDASTVRQNRDRSLEGLFRAYLDRSGLMRGCAGAQLDTAVHAIDATPYVADECVSTSGIKVGDAALALDPLSSSGVQKAVQTALAGAIVANTLLRRPESAAMAMRFYRTTIDEAAARHRAWAASHYAVVAARQGGSFWLDRAGVPAASGSTRHVAAGSSQNVASGFSRKNDSAEDVASAFRRQDSCLLSASVAFVDVPCIEGEFVTTRTAVHHPGLDEPLAYLAGWELWPLLKRIQAGMTPTDIVQAWSDRVPLRSAFAIVAWLLDHELLVPAPAGPPPSIPESAAPALH